MLFQHLRNNMHTVLIGMLCSPTRSINWWKGKANGFDLVNKLFYPLSTFRYSVMPLILIIDKLVANKILNCIENYFNLILY